jgi:hypothetical protein
MNTGKLPIPRDLKGDIISLNNLPEPNAGRWTANRKYTVVAAVRYGLITLEQALARYGMTEREFEIWEQGAAAVNVSDGLKVTHYQRRGSPR